MQFVQEHATWVSKAQIKPSVALAVINTVANIALAILIGQGVAISWWRSALEGATVKDLHQSWGFSTSILELLTAGKKFNLIALAALAAKMALLDNLLLQQAAGTIPSIFVQDEMNIRIPSVRVLPRNYAGIWDENTYKGASSLLFSQDFKQYLSSPDFIDFGINGSIENFDMHCIGSCFSSVAGFGFNVTCDPETPSNEEWTDYLVTPERTAASDEYLAAEIAREQGGNFTDTGVAELIPSLFTIVIQDLKAGPSSYDQNFPFETLQIIIQYSRLRSDASNISTCRGTQFSRICYLRKFFISSHTLNSSISVRRELTSIQQRQVKIDVNKLLATSSLQSNDIDLDSSALY